MGRARALVWVVLLLVPAIGCASVPYEFGGNFDSGVELRPGEEQVERGRPQRVLDGLGHYVISLPGKLLLWSWKVDDHRISPETEEAIRVYLRENELRGVKVRLNQYAPGGEWRRLARNRGMPGFWRWTLGAISVVGYTVLPGRLFGGDNYNPYTDTVSLYSDHRSIALHEAGHAKDFAEKSRGWRGVYSALRLLPLVPLWQEAEATADALGYEQVCGTPRDEKRAYKILYPAYGTYVGGEAARFVGGGAVGYAIQYGTVIPGHLIGRVRAAFVSEEPRASVCEQTPPPAPLPEDAVPEAEDAVPEPLPDP